MCVCVCLHTYSYIYIYIYKASESYADSKVQAGDKPSSDISITLALSSLKISVRLNSADHTDTGLIPYRVSK